MLNIFVTCTKNSSGITTQPLAQIVLLFLDLWVTFSVSFCAHYILFLNPFQLRDAIWHHAFHLFLICMPFAH